jgi:hypothetical protein
MSTITIAPIDSATSPSEVKAPWRFARERRLGRVARQLVGFAEPELPWALGILGPEAVMAATRRPAWALACLESAAECDDGSEGQGAWVILAASRPTVVRRLILGAPNRRRSGEARRVA